MIMNFFRIFLDFATYWGILRAFLFVATYFLGEAIIKKLPAELDEAAHNGNKLANFLLFDFKTKKCPVIYDLY